MYVSLYVVCLSVSLYEHSHLDLARSPNRRKALRRFGELAVNIHNSSLPSNPHCGISAYSDPTSNCAKRTSRCSACVYKSQPRTGHTLGSCGTGLVLPPVVDDCGSTCKPLGPQCAPSPTARFTTDPARPAPRRCRARVSAVVPVVRSEREGVDL